MPKEKAEPRKGAKGSTKKKSENTVSRRTVLKAGAVAGTVAVLAPNIFDSSTAIALAVQGGGPPAEPDLDACRANPPVNSPATTPFRDTFTAPFPAIPQDLNPAPTKARNLAGGEAERADHQRWNEFLPEVEYEMEAKAALHTFHADYSPSYIWGFNGNYPSSTVLNIYNHPTIVRFRNSLPTTTTTFGKNEITIHLHNGHHGSESDGFAGDFFGTGFWKDNHYVNVYAGYDNYPPVGDTKEAMHSFWFHDHRAAFTANNNYLGLNGMYLVYDSKDPGHEFNVSGSLRLPGYYGITDFPVILTDKKFCATANGRTELFNTVGAGPPAGDKWIVNGKIQPKMTVRKRKYRFRFLNTGPAKTYDITLIKPDGSVGTINVVATDANFLEHPIAIDAGANAGNSNSTTAPIVPGALRVSVAERYDVIIDFSDFSSGDKLYLRENQAQFVGVASPDALPAGLLIENVLMQFNVVNTEWWFPPDTPAVPSTLCTYPTLPTTDSTFEWQFVRDPVGSVPRLFKVNNRAFDASIPQHCILQGTTEEWLLNNNVGGSAWTHPVHIHFEEFRVLKRFVNGVEVPVPPLMTGRKDVMRLEAGQGALIKMQFRDFVGRYLIHCHNMGHEDAFMMVRWDIVPDAAAKAACDALIAQHRKEEDERLAEMRKEAKRILPKEEVS
ncbi:MAG TPA: multicopper oxidase domain-containing protein [Pyrinomonadaceae bacterium]|jgi:FtsP/CotA-like multicopper oxidase with cupredoxin domain|nr:multicopper oxidase domain-containing protein [Pyrinomonadaceae bacterium]